MFLPANASSKHRAARKIGEKTLEKMMKIGL